VRQGLRSWCVVLVIFLGSEHALARSWYVTPNGIGDAPTIQAAVDSASAGDEVVLAPGAYTWSSQSASGLSMVTINKSITLRGEAGAESTILDAENNSGRVIGTLGSAIVTISGITARGGHPPIGQSGGGIQLLTSGSTLSHCIIRDNRTESFGGGAGVACGRCTVTDCQILNNHAGADADGGGIFIGLGVLRRCVIRGNSARGDPGGSGGGVSAYDSEIVDCVIEDNRATGPFGGRGGGLYASGDVGVTISRCTFVGNRAESELSSALGGAIATSELTPVSITECVFLGNRATGSVTGTIFSSHAGVEISNCTLIGNASGIGGGIVRNSIIMGCYEGRACATITTMTCTVLYANALGNEICGTDGGGNFSADPQFCAADPVASRSVLLQSDSPCANAPGCGRIGAAPVGCEAVSIESLPWSRVKSIYRR